MIGETITRAKAIRESNASVASVLMERLGSGRVVDAPGPDSWLNPSALPRLCPRAIVMAYRLKVPMADSFDPQARWNMDRGTAMHVMFQDMWLGPLGLISGGWKCPRCSHVHGVDPKGDVPGVPRHVPIVTVESAIKRPEICGACKYKPHPIEPFSYVEPWTSDSFFKVRGKMDGLLWLPGHYMEVLDIKSTSRIERILEYGPSKDHVIQVHWYMDATGCRKARLLYVDPGADKIENAFVERQVSYDPELMQAEKEKVRGLREALREESRPVPDCPYDRKRYGRDCDCVEVALLWSRAGR